MKKGKIKTILEDHWDGFLKIYENKIRDNVNKEVEKIKNDIGSYRSKAKKYKVSIGTISKIMNNKY